MVIDHRGCICEFGAIMSDIAKKPQRHSGQRPRASLGEIVVCFCAIKRP